MTARKTAITCASAACLAIVLPAVKKSEGYWPTVKVDTVGTGRPCTGGYGETENVKCGETHSETYWSERLKMRLADEYDREIGKCIHVELPDSVRAAAITTAYNAGSAAVCKSPMVAKWNAGDFRGGCEALLTKNAAGRYTGWYITAQHRVLQGLIHRRADDKKMCLSGLASGPQTAMTPAGETVDGVSWPWPSPDTAPRKPHRPLPKPRPAAPPPRPWYWWVFK